MNKSILMGRLTGDPEIRYTNDGKPVVRFNFAVNRRFAKESDEVKADFFSCVAFGTIAEGMEKCSIGKGTKLLIECECRNNNYTDKNGNKVYGTQMLVNNFEFCESKGSSGFSAAPSAPGGDGFMNIPDGVEDEGLPFN